MRLLLIFVMSVAGLSLATCGNHNTSDKPVSESSDTVMAADLALPAIPDSLVVPEERAAFLSVHFWDDMDWKDHARSLDTAIVEQNFVNYLTVLALNDSVSRSEAVKHLMTAAETDSTAFSFLAETASKYLHDPNSPMLNDDFFLLFIHEIIGSKVLSPLEKARYEYLETRIRKNRPGSIGADFTFVDRSGKYRNLGKTVGKTEYTLLLFYDYDCETCAAVEKEMIEDHILNDAITSGLLQVVAINVFGDDLSKWKSLSATLPDRWIVGYSPACEVVDKEIYCVDAAPTIYLLDSKRRVILKDAPLKNVISVLESIKSSNLESISG